MLLDDGDGFGWVGVEDRLPTASPGGVDVFGAIIQVEQVGSLQVRELFDGCVDRWVGFHATVLVGEDIAGEGVVEGVGPGDVADGEIVGVGEDIGGDAGSPEAPVQIDHFGDGIKDIGEKGLEFFEGIFEARFAAEYFEECLRGDFARFVAMKQGRLIYESKDFRRGKFAVGSKGTGGTAEIEIEEDISEIENNGLRHKR